MRAGLTIALQTDREQQRGNSSRPRQSTVSRKKFTEIELQGSEPGGLPANFAQGSRICFVTTEFHGLFRNGGIGTANTGLALVLAAAGYDVSVAYANADQAGPRNSDGNFDELRERYRGLGITLDFVPAPRSMWQPFDDARGASYAVYLYLRSKSFDIVYFNECGGHPYYSVLAKHTGVFPNAPELHLVTHGAHEWLHEINLVRYYNTQPVIISFMERRSVELADVVISPSRYLLDWMRERKWKLPPNTFVEQNVVAFADGAEPTPPTELAEISEIVFFGRQEIRKGLKLFCDAIDRMAASPALRRVQITFLGKFSRVEGLHSGAYILERSKEWRTKIRILVKKPQESAICYLKRAGVLAVMPSLAENSPCVVIECVQHGVPFIATDSGGTAELIDAADREDCLVAADPQRLADRLARVLAQGQRLARLSIPQAQTRRNWVRFHTPTKSRGDLLQQPRSDAPKAGRRGNGRELPLVSVCLVHYNSPVFIHQSLSSVLEQSYSKYEVIIIDDGSTDRQALSILNEIETTTYSIPLKVVRQKNSYLGAARNTGARHASGEYLLFVDDDNVLMPDCISTYVSAAGLTGADIVTSVPLQFRHDRRPERESDNELYYLPIGGCAELGAFENCFGDANALISRRAFETVGGFHEDFGKAVEDWQFFAQAVLKGLRIELVPEPVFWYRVRSSGMLNRSNLLENHRRILNAYRDAPISTISKIVEGLIDIEGQEMHRLSKIHSIFEDTSRNLLFRMSSGDVNGREALGEFRQFCLDRGRVDEALDFALYNDLPLLENTVHAVADVVERTSLDSVRRGALQVRRTIDLTDPARQIATPVPGLRAEMIERPDGQIASHRVSEKITALKVAGVCPPGTVRANIGCSITSAGTGVAAVAIVLCKPHVKIRLAQDYTPPMSDAWWSDWVDLSSGSGTSVVSATIPDPSRELLDLFLLSKLAAEGPELDGVVHWESLECQVTSSANPTVSAIEVTGPAMRLPLSVMEQGVLLSDVSHLDYTVFRPGEPALLHPIHNDIALVRLANALPAGSWGVRGTVGVGDPRAHPIEFGMWLCRSSRLCRSFADLDVADTFSGWFTVSEAKGRHWFGASLVETSTEPMDLYLATRVVDRPNVYFCHAHWHQIDVLG
jgi:O-antigen biosynthesis protein